MFPVGNLIVGRLKLVQLVDVPEHHHDGSDEDEGNEALLDDALEAVVVVDLQHRVVEVLEVGHEPVYFSVGVLALC